MAVEVRRDAGRGFFLSLEKYLQSDEFLADKQCIRLLIDKAETEHRTQSRKRFDSEAAFRRLLYTKFDDYIADWCRKRDIRADPFKVLRYEGSERGPTQHDTAIGPSMPYIERAFARLAENVPEITNCRGAVLKAPTKAISPAFRLQQPPLPFGACGEIKYGGARKDFDRAIYLTAMEVATRGDVSRSWSYDCGCLVFYGLEPPRTLLGDELWQAWPEVQQRIWESGRLWAILL